jgi:uncharacterized protein (TIGR03083 family)
MKEKTMDTLADQMALVQAESARLIQYLKELPTDAWDQPSACTQWQIQDVVAHMSGVAEFYRDTISRGLQGDTTPPEGVPSAGTVNAAAMAEPLAQMARDTREQLGDHVLATFEATITRLNDLLSGVGSDEWDRPCYHPWRLMPLRQFLAMTLQELVLHGWDIRSRLAPDASLSPEGFPALVELITTSSTSGFLTWAFRPGPRLSAPVCYRFDVTGPGASRIDFVIEGDQAHIEAAGDRSPSVTFHCDTETYLLVMYGRLNLEGARSLGRLRIEGDQALATTFAQWFKGA